MACQPLIPARAETPKDPVPACKLCVAQAVNELTGLLDEAESQYLHYRWAQASLRDLYYEFLWRARFLSNDPLSKETRARGKLEEEKWLVVRGEYEKKSTDASNALMKLLDELEQGYRRLELCQAKEPYFRQCIQGNYPHLVEAVRTFRDAFQEIFEHERGYLKDVMTASGLRDGVYLDDILETEAEHTDFYWRFEADKVGTSFQDDRRAMEFFFEARRFLMLEFDGVSCCYPAAEHDF